MDLAFRTSTEINDHERPAKARVAHHLSEEAVENLEQVIKAWLQNP